MVGNLDLKIRGKKQRKLEKEKQQLSRKLARVMASLGERECSLELILGDGRRVYGQFWEEWPELKKGDVIIARVEESSFFDDFIASQVMKGLGDTYEAMRRGFEILLRSVKRRNPFEHLEAKKRGYYLSIKTRLKEGISPERLEAYYMAHFKEEARATIEEAKNWRDLKSNLRWLINKYRQLLPYTLRTIFFSDHEGSPNLGKAIQKKFGLKARELMAAYVFESTEGPIFEKMRLVTIDNEGEIGDYVLNENPDLAVSRFNAAHYLAASRHLEALYEGLQTSLEKRIEEGIIEGDDLKKGIEAYLDSLVNKPTYRLRLVKEGERLSLEEKELEVVAVVVLTEKKYSKLLKKKIKPYQKEGLPVSWQKGFKFLASYY